MEESHQSPEQIETASASPAAAPKSIWSIMVGVFTGPTAAFESFKAHPSWVIPLIVVMLLGGLNGALMGPYGGQAQVDMLGTSTSLPPEVMDKMIENAAESSPVTSFLGGAFFLGFVTLLTAGVVMIFGKFLFGGSATFMSIWGVTLLAELIGMVGGLLRMPLVFAKDTMFVSYGLASLMPGKDLTSIFYSLTYYCDFFWFWSAIAAGIGYATLFGISRGKGLTASFVTFFMFVVLLILLSSVGLSFAGVEISFF